MVDLVLMILLVALAFGFTCHPYFFGDELMMHRLAIKHDYAFWSIFREINTYKPRLIANGIATLLVEWQAPRWVTASLQAGCLVWINALLYAAARYLYGADRLLAWLLMASVATSRYAVVLYFDYSSGLLDLLSTALLLSALLAANFAWRERFDVKYAACALGAAVLCIFVHERFVAGLLVAGCAIALAEWFGPSARRRKGVIAWALSLGVLPLVLFWLANRGFSSLPLATGTAGLPIVVGFDTALTFLAYAYNVFFGGNYGHAWFWGTYNHLHPIGWMLALGTAACTALLIALIVVRHKIAWRNRWPALALLAVTLAMVAVASLPGSEFLQPRWMFPVGVLLGLIVVMIVTGVWRYAVIALMLATNVTYLLLGSQDSMAQVSASRSAHSLAAMVLAETPMGASGVVVGFPGAGWTIGGGSAIDMGPRPGDTFSKVSLKSAVHLDPFVSGRAFDPTRYDFAVAFNGFTPNLTARFRFITVEQVPVIAGASKADRTSIEAAVQDRQTAAAAPDAIPSGATALDGGHAAPTALAVEFYNKSLDHYFITHNPKEIAILDAGVAIRNWTRTGQSFAVYTASFPGASAVCRFYIPPDRGDSHFFGRGSLECSGTAVDNPSFVNEDNQFFYIVLPHAGNCPAGMREVYRLFSNRADANHRYTIDRAIRDRMVASGWLAEGDGPNTVVMCVPIPGS